MNFQKILIPSDLEFTESAAFEMAAKLLREGESEVVLLHILEQPAFVEDAGMPLPVSIKNWSSWQRKRAAENFEKIKNNYFSELSLKHSFKEKEKSVAEDIVDFAHTNDFDLILLPLEKSDDLSVSLPGSISQKLISFSRLPIIFVPRLKAE